MDASLTSVISVVIPAYNSAQHIIGSIDSVLGQSISEFEIIVVDDGSKDNSKEVVEPYLTDPRIRYIYQENRGLPGARNTGAQHAKGKYLAFLDADDFLAPNALERMRGEFERSGATWGNVGVLKIEPARKTVRPARMPHGDLFLAILQDDFITRCPFFRASGFFALGMYDPDMRVREDWDINIRLIASGQPFVCIDEPLYHYTRTEGSITTGNRRRLLSFTEILMRKHHKALADSGNRAVAKIYARNLWHLARLYFYELNDSKEAWRCARESLRYDKNVWRLVHPLIHRLRTAVR